MIKNRNTIVIKTLFALIAPIACILLFGFFSFANVEKRKIFAWSVTQIGGGIICVSNNSTLNMTDGSLSGGDASNGGDVNPKFASTESYGGAVYIATGGTMNLSGGTISKNSATYGGGVCIVVGGTFNMSGGTISENVATTFGSDIYNSDGNFTMTGGVVGKEGSINSGFGIYNFGTMNLYGGTVYDSVYSSSTMNTKMSATILGEITLGNYADIVVQDYAGTTPKYTISVSASRGMGTLITFVGSDTEPDISALNVSGYDSETYILMTVKNTDGNWTVSLRENSFDFPTTWKDEIASSNYMTTTVMPTDLTSIKFVSTVPSGYTQIGTLSTDLPVYQGSTATDIAFVSAKIYAPKDCYQLFYNLIKMTSIEFDVFDTSKVTNMSFMFRSCSKLTSLDLSNFDTSKVTSMSNVFNDCYTLPSLDLSSFNTSNVQSMFEMFRDCYVLTSLNVGNFNTSNVTTMSCMFSGCKTLETLNVSNFNTSNVTNMSGMFQECRSITSLDVSSFITSKVTDMSFMFSYCTSLTSLDVSNLGTSKVTNMKYMFSGCWNLSSLDLSKFITSSVTNMECMFLDCSDLTSLSISNFNTSNVTTMYSMFGNCMSLTSLNISNFNTSKVTDMSVMFNKCSKLTSLNISNFNTLKVTDMKYMFYGCSALKTLDLSRFNMVKATSVSNMLNFGSSNKIQTLKTPYGNTVAIPITTGSTLYRSDTGAVVTSVPANLDDSITLTSTQPSGFADNGNAFALGLKNGEICLDCFDSSSFSQYVVEKYILPNNKKTIGVAVEKEKIA